MIGQRFCPFCRVPAVESCGHLAVAFEARDFVRGCIHKCAAEKQWLTLCTLRLDQRRRAGQWSPEVEDFTWLESAFCEEFLKPLAWFGAMDYEWRTGPKPGQGGFWVLLWSKSPDKLWWELRDELEKQIQQLQLSALPPYLKTHQSKGAVAPGLSFH
jgi:hypothetical protein